MLTVIIPTIGRPTLAEALASLAPAGLRADDEVIVVADGLDLMESVCALVDSVPLPARPRVIAIERAGDYGHTPRNEALEEARGDRIVSLDDDDLAEPGSYDRVRALAEAYPDRPLVLRFEAQDGRVIPYGPYLLKATIGTPAFVPLNIEQKIAPYPPHHGGDWDHIVNTIALQGDPVFDPQIIARCRRVD